MTFRKIARRIFGVPPDDHAALHLDATPDSDAEPIREFGDPDDEEFTEDEELEILGDDYFPESELHFHRSAVEAGVARGTIVRWRLGSGGEQWYRRTRKPIRGVE